jgi:Domain of unknown function (DUF4133)
MANSIYRINKGINTPVEFRGLKSQYIWYLGGALVILMIVFAIMYIAGINPFFCIGLILTAGGFVFHYVYRLSNKYGEHGMKKKIAKRHIPKTVKCYNRKIFTHGLLNYASR